MLSHTPLILPQNILIGRRRRSLGWLLIPLFLLTSACGAGNAPPSGGSPTPQPVRSPTETPLPAPSLQSSPTPTVSPTPTPPPVRGVHISLWHSLPPAWLRGPLARFNRENAWGITIEERAFADENALQESLPQAPPGTLILGYPTLSTAWPQGFSDMRPWVGAPAFGLSAAEKQDFIPTFWQEGLSGEGQYALPFLRSAAFLVRNHSWAAELEQAPIPQDIAAFQQQACAANASLQSDDDVYNDGLGGWLVDSQPAVMLGWLYAFGASPYEQGRYRFDTPETESAFTFLKALFDENCAWVGNDSYPDAYLSKRQALFAAATLSDLPYIEQAFEEAGARDSWGALPFPAAQGEPVLPTFGPSFALTAGATPQQALAAWLFVRTLLQSDVQTEVVTLSGYLPVRYSALQSLQAYGAQHPAWQSVANALPHARPEPAQPSWLLVQWMLQDAGTQLFRPYYTLERIPDTLQLLDETANAEFAP